MAIIGNIPYFQTNPYEYIWNKFIRDIIPNKFPYEYIPNMFYEWLDLIHKSLIWIRAMKGIHHPEIWTFWDSCRMVFFVFSEDRASLLLLAPQFGEFQMFISVFECPFFIENPINSLSLVISMRWFMDIHGSFLLAGCSSTLRCGFLSFRPIKKKTKVSKCRTKILQRQSKSRKKNEW